MREATSPPPEVHYHNLQRAASPDPSSQQTNNHHNGTRLPAGTVMTLGRNAGNGIGSPTTSNNNARPSSVAASSGPIVPRPGSPATTPNCMQHLSPSPHRMTHQQQQSNEEEEGSTGVQGQQQGDASVNNSSSPTPLHQQQTRNSGLYGQQASVTSGNRSPNNGMIQRRHKFRHQGSSRSTGSAASTDDASPCISRGESPRNISRSPIIGQVPLILDHLYLVGKLTSSKIADTKVSKFQRF
jgi:hypothetical protein